MKPILLFLLILSPAVHAEAEICKSLTDVVQHYETKLKWTSINDGSGVCTPAASIELVKKTHPKFTKKQQAFVKEFGCHSLASIEQRIAQLENEQSLLTGFHKLKADLAQNKKQTNDSNPENAKRAGLNFVDGLNAAGAIEVLLETPEGNMLKALKSLPLSERNNVENVKKALRKICDSDKNTKVGACRKDAWKPNATALAAINELIDNSELDGATIQSWNQAIAIRRVDEEGKERAYSFKKMSEELTEKIGDISSGRLTLTKKELNAIKRLPDFEDDSLGLSGMESDIKPFELMQEYKFHVLDLKQRQEFEVQSNVVLAFHDAKTEDGFLAHFLPEELSACEESKMDFLKALTCLESINKHGDKLPGTKRSRIQEIQESTRISKNYLESLVQKHNLCLGVEVSEDLKNSGALPKSCLMSLAQADERLSALSSELLALNAIREEIAKQNEDELNIRDFAVANLSAQKGCTTIQESTLSCPMESLSIAPTLEVLTSHIADLMVINKSPVSINDKDWLCGNENIKAYKKELLCTVGNLKPKDPVLEKKKEKVFEAPVTPPDGDYNSPAKDAALNGLGHLAGNIIGTLFAPKPQYNWNTPYNPYLYNYSPYNNGLPMMGISDELLFNARYYGGYGLYMPTQGLPPYHAFGSPVLSYPTLSTPRSSYFTGR